MKHMLAVITASLLCAASSRAQYVVYDPAMHSQTIIDEARNMAEFVQMIDNQVQQITTMTSQLQQFGNPALVIRESSIWLASRA